MHTCEWIGEVELLKLVGEDLAVEYPAGRQYANVRLIDMLKQIIKAILTWENIIVHTPNPVGTIVKSSLYSGIEAT